jgi:lysophospholipase L1-like esterase
MGALCPCGFGFLDEGRNLMKRRVVFAGDSIVHGGPWQYWLQKHYVTNFAFPGHTTEDLDALIPAIVASQPEILIVMIGTNDFGKHRLPEAQVIKNILNVAEKLKDAMPDIPIIWHSLTPRSDEFSLSMIEVNNAIRPKLQSSGFIFHDVFPLLKNKNENKLELEFCEDPDTFGLHLNKLGYEKWYESLGPLIDEHLATI